MLAQEVVKEYGEKVRYQVQDFGASPLADRFGIDKYPAIFVDDALVALPEDFYEWGSKRKGRYVPWAEVANRRKYQADLKKMIDLRLAGGALPSLKVEKSRKVDKLPAINLVDLDGKTFNLAQLTGKPVIVEFWAPWCPPCIKTMEWFKEKKPAADIIAVAVESDRQQVVEIIAKIRPPVRTAMATDEIREAFDGPPAYPTLVLADKNGKVVRVFYGAPPNLHAEIEKALKNLRRQ